MFWRYFSTVVNFGLCGFDITCVPHPHCCAFTVLNLTEPKTMPTFVFFFLYTLSTDPVGFERNILSVTEWTGYRTVSYLLIYFA